MSNPVLHPPPLRNYFITELQIFILGNGPEEFQQCSVLSSGSVLGVSLGSAPGAPILKRFYHIQSQCLNPGNISPALSWRGGCIYWFVLVVLGGCIYWEREGTT